jgi:hypothetical protein
VTVNECVDAFSFLTEGLGFVLSGTLATGRGFSVQFRRASVGVEVSYRIGQATAIDVCLLNEDGSFPKLTGEMRPDTTISRFDLMDIESQVGITVPVDQAEYAIPTKERLVGYARRLQTSSQSMLLGDTSLVPDLRAKVLNRGRDAAFAKWGIRAAEFGW